MLPDNAARVLGANYATPFKFQDTDKVPESRQCEYELVHRKYSWHGDNTGYVIWFMSLQQQARQVQKGLL